MKNDFKFIGFDADDTLWVNEPYYHEIEQQFSELLQPYFASGNISEELFKVEMQNLELYGYGAKSFTLSMVETALKLSDYAVDQKLINEIIKLGKGLMQKDVHLLEGVRETLEFLYQNNTRMIVATKGDLKDQERKLEKSNLQQYFHHIEIMSNKHESDYLKLLAHLDIDPEDFLMIGNSIKSDIIPVLNIGGNCIHVPYHTTWQHETVNEWSPPEDRFLELEHISQLIKYFNK